jgi:Domain of unknown function (DUF4355)
MSEDAGAATAAPETGQTGEGTDVAAPDTEEHEAAGLLGNMLSKDPDALATELAKWKTEARKWEGRAKSNSEAAAQLKEIQNKNKTDLQRAQEAQQEAERQRDEATAMHHRVMAAASNNLPVGLIDYLGSGTEEEIMERATGIGQEIEAEVDRRVKEALAGGTQGRNGFRQGARPVESMRAGAAPSSDEKPAGPEQWFRKLLNQARNGE